MADITVCEAIAADVEAS